MVWRNKPLRWLIVGGVLLVVSTAQAQELLELSAGIYRIRAEVANTEESRAKGLMRRNGLPANNGMLFVFARSALHCMWMRNTLIPLSVAFADRQGRIINIAEMLPQTEDNHCAAKPAKFALEMNADWFNNRGIGAGMLLTGMDKAPPSR